MASPLRSAAPAIALSVILMAPFLGKAFTIDDTVFMREARHALADPLHPTSFEMVWAEAPERVSTLVPTGPVMAWLLMPSAWAGGAEWAAHVVQLVLLGLAILATTSLALRFGLDERWAAAAGLLVGATPAVLAMTGTAMPDVAAMSLGVCGIERFVAWTEERGTARAVTAALLLGLAALTRTHAILLVGVAGILGAPAIWRGSWRERLLTIAPLVAAMAVMGAVWAIAADPFRGAGSIAEAAARYSSASSEHLASNAVAFGVHWVLAMAFAVPWLALRWRKLVTTRAGVIALGVAAATSVALVPFARRPSVPLAVVAGLGFAAILDALALGWTRRDARRVALACWLLVALCAVPYVQLPPKLLVLAAPAAALLVADQLAVSGRRTAFAVLGTTILAGAALGVAILRADSALGDLGRRAAAELIAPRVAAGQRVWFVGHWGFQWYAENAGGIPATITAPYPGPGDHLVVSLGSDRSDDVLQAIATRNPALTRVGELQDAVPGGRIMNKRLGAGFYSNRSGYWPWVWGDGPIDVFLSFDL